MTADHRIEVDGSPGTNDLIAGKWWRKSASQIGIDVDRLAGDTASGSGTLTLDGQGSFSRVDISGRYRGSSFAMAFRVTGAQEEGDGGLSASQKQRFVGAARQGVRDEFSRSTQFDFWEETVGELRSGQRKVTGYLRARGGNKPGTYKYEVTVTAVTMRARSVKYTRV
jgi:hypothetical protein